MSLRAVMAGIAAVSISLGGPVAPVSAGRPEAVVHTTDGWVRGTMSDGYRTFLGLPYAAAPVGARRWQPPAPAQPWSGVRDASRPGNRCAQPADPVSGSPGSSSEDCLYLNVSVPAERSGAALPVVVWIHGGGFSTGSGSDVDPRRLTTEGHVIVVSFNYRLGVFGFFGYPDLAGSGTFAVQDQQAALRWVRRNIARFGGDDHSVTLYGESAGADSVCSQLAAPAARGLFDAAVIQSGTCSAENGVDDLYPGAGPAVATWKPLATTESAGVAVSHALHCTGDAMACLRGQSAASLLSTPAVATVYWSPAYDTPTLPRQPADAITAGSVARVPVILGTTRDEATIIVAASFRTLDAPALDGLLRRAFGARADLVAAAYPLGRYGSPAQTWAAIVTDRAYVCPSRSTLRQLGRLVPTYGYEFADERAPLIFHTEAAFPLGAYHGSDLAYLWDLPATPVTFTAAQQHLATQLLRYVTAFAARHDPNGPGRPYWPTVARTQPSGAVQQLAPDDVHPVNTDRLHRCDLW